MHRHVLTPAVEALTAQTPQKLAEPAAMRRAKGDASVEHNLRVMLPAAAPKLKRNGQRQPGDRVRRLFFDTGVCDQLALRQLIEVAGVPQVLAGTDHPFDMGLADLHGLVNAAPGLDDSAGGVVLGGNAVRLFGLNRCADTPKR